jgi:hypothetical protein
MELEGEWEAETVQARCYCRLSPRPNCPTWAQGGAYAGGYIRITRSSIRHFTFDLSLNIRVQLSPGLLLWQYLMTMPQNTDSH